MFDIGAIELLVIAIVAIVVVGPKDLPVLLRKIGGVISYFKKMSSDFQSHVKETIDETGVTDIKETFDDVAQYDWSGEDERKAQAHNEKIMREHETGEEEKKTTPRKRAPRRKPRKKTAKSRKTTSKSSA